MGFIVLSASAVSADETRIVLKDGRVARRDNFQRWWEGGEKLHILEKLELALACDGIIVTESWPADEGGG